VQVIVLGSAAGGGVPQWNCRCPVCRLAWMGDGRVLPRTQSSLAVSANGESWVLLNASPDIRQQIAATPRLQPRCEGRDSPIAAVILTNGDVDHVAGLLGLRERQNFVLYATAETLAVLSRNRVFDVLDRNVVRREPVRLGHRFDVLPGLAVELFSVPGKVPLWLEETTANIHRDAETTVGAVLTTRDRRTVHVPGCAAPNPTLRRHAEGADLLFFDGTLWRDDEMIRSGVGGKTGRRMGHMSMSGERGSIATFAGMPIGRRVFIHMNNTNPALIEGSAERAEVESAGWGVAHDGMEFAL